MSRTRQRIPASQRLRSAADFTRLRAEGRALRGQHCLVVVAECPGEPRKVAFVASRKGVGGAVERNRARRRMREIVRRLWPLLQGEGRWMMFVANRSILQASHEQLVADIERLVARALASQPAGEAS